MAPLQVLLFRHPADKDTIPFEEAIIRGYQGGKEAGGYLATGEDLGIQLECFNHSPANHLSVDKMLDSFCHTLVVILIDRKLFEKGGSALVSWLEQCWTHVRNSNGRHYMLPVGLDERVGNQFWGKNTTLSQSQVLQVHDLGEKAIRPSMLALRLIHECRVLLAEGLPSQQNPKTPPGFLRLFISHAKIDGLPLAHALKHQIQELKWLDKFYDVDDLPAGGDWQKDLERGVESSLVIMLRTEVYDSRYWCQQEVIWADRYAVPAVLIDARTGLNHSAGSLPFDRLPSVRIPDGNLLRILFAALREALRFLYFMRSVQEMKQGGQLSEVNLRVFSFQPSMPALLHVCQLFQNDIHNAFPKMILYPDPPLRTGIFEAAAALVEKYSPGTRLVTPNTIAAEIALS